MVREELKQSLATMLLRLYQTEAISRVSGYVKGELAVLLYVSHHPDGK